MSNINNSLGTNGAYGGRTSVEAFNDDLAVYKTGGILSGWQAVANGGMSVALGGTSGVRDVAIALDNNGNKTTINNISKAPIIIEMPASPASDSSLVNVVAYISKPVKVEETTLDNPGAVNIFTTTESTDAGIRSAITLDGGTGANAYYVILASVNIPAQATDLTDDMIEQAQPAKINGNNLDFSIKKSTEGNGVSKNVGVITVFEVNNITHNTPFSLTTNTGRTYDVKVSNGGTQIKIQDPDLNIAEIEVTNYIKSQNWVGKNLGAGPIASGAMYVRNLNGIGSGAKVNTEYKSTTADAEPYKNFISNSITGNVTQSVIHYNMKRLEGAWMEVNGHWNAWNLQFTQYFTARIASQSAGEFPALYYQNYSDSNRVANKAIIKIVETK